MEIRKHQYIDIFYNKDEQKEADKAGKYLKSLGYIHEHRDAGAVHDFCDQYLKPMRFLKVKDKTE